MPTIVVGVVDAGAGVGVVVLVLMFVLVLVFVTSVGIDNVGESTRPLNLKVAFDCVGRTNMHIL